MVGGGVVPFTATHSVGVFPRLNFSRRGEVTRQDETGDPKLVREATGEEVLFVMENQEGVPVEVNSPVTDGVTVPGDLVVWLLWDGDWVFVGFRPAPPRP